MCRWLYLLPSVLILGCIPVTTGSSDIEREYSYGPHTLIATADNDYVPESSGIVASHLNTDVYWTHNDSANTPRIWAFRLNETDITAKTPKHLGYVELTGTTARDWEDIARGPDNQIYIFDGGDNSFTRTDKRILRFAEPQIKPSATPVRLQVSPDVVRFEYPDPGNPTQPAGHNEHRYDAESLFVHPASGDLFIFTKRGTSGPTARVYKLPVDILSWNATEIHVLQFVADLSGTIGGMTTAADIAPEGQRIVIRTYFTAYEFIAPDDGPFDAIFDQTPSHTLFLAECQGEAICYTADGSDLITTSETRPEFFCTSRMPVYTIPAISAQPTQ